MTADEKRRRRPYLSKNVIAGLETLFARVKVETTDEAQALLWLARMARWRVDCAAMDSHDASVSPSTREPMRLRTAPADGGAA